MSLFKRLKFKRRKNKFDIKQSKVNQKLIRQVIEEDKEILQAIADSTPIYKSDMVNCNNHEQQLLELARRLEEKDKRIAELETEMKRVAQQIKESLGKVKEHGENKEKEH